MLRHNFGLYFKEPTSSYAILLNTTEQIEYLNIYNDCITKFLFTKPTSELHSVQGLGKIRIAAISKNDDLTKLQQNVITYDIQESESWQTTELLRETKCYYYLPKPVKFGLLNSLIEFLDIKTNCSVRPNLVSKIAIDDEKEDDHPMRGLIISDSKYLEAIAIYYLQMSAHKKVITHVSGIDVKPGTRRIVNKLVLTCSDEILNFNYLYIPLYGAEVLVIHIPLCSNLDEGLKRYQCDLEINEEFIGVKYYSDIFKTKIYEVKSDNTKNIHRNLIDSCNDMTCMLPQCVPALHFNKAEIEVDTELLHNIKIENDTNVKLDDTDVKVAINELVGRTFMIQPPLPQRWNSKNCSLNDNNHTNLIDDESEIALLNIDPMNLVNLDLDVWETFGVKLNIISKIPLDKLEMRDMLLNVALLDMSRCCGKC